jgi:DnaJ like chaperone protein
MSIWSRILTAIEAFRAGEPLSAVLDHLRLAPERSTAFTIGVIALGAKLAKADGKVTRDEVATFRAVFQIAPEDEAQAARVFNLAREDVAGFDSYARKVSALFPPGDPVLRDLMEGLFAIAMADGDMHPAEEAYLQQVADIFGLPESCFRALRARFVPASGRDPFEVLELPGDASLAAARRAYRRLVRENHPDALRGRGIPDEAVHAANARLSDLNAAWEAVQAARAA